MSNSALGETLAQQHQLGELLRSYGWNQQLFRGYRRTLWIALPFAILPSLVILGLPFLMIWGCYAWVIFRCCLDTQPKILGDAALIGVCIGVILGLFRAIVSGFFMDIPANEVEKTVSFLLGMIKIGCLVCPLFSVLSTYVQKGRRLAN